MYRLNKEEFLNAVFNNNIFNWNILKPWNVSPLELQAESFLLIFKKKKKLDIPCESSAKRIILV